MNNNTDNLFEQMANISKAYAYDILVEQVKELKERYDNLRTGINNILDEISKIEPSEFINDPSIFIVKIGNVCNELLRQNRPS